MPRPMTAEGYDAISAEFDRLWSVERPEVVREVSAAAELGDRSENAAYIYGKKRLRSIDSRMRYLRRKLDGVRRIEVGDILPTSKVRWGAIVVVEDGDGNSKTWRIVDKEESDVKAGRISAQSPVGAALLGKEPGDEAVVKRPKGDIVYEVIEVRYGTGAP